MIIESYKAEHLHLLDLQEGQAYLSKHIGPEHATMLESDTSFTGTHDGRVIFTAGLIPVWQGRAIVWAYLGRTAGEHMLAVHRAVVKFLNMQTGMRIEASVDAEFKPGHRWVELLGFELETPRMRKFRPDGGDCAMYVRIR